MRRSFALVLALLSAWLALPAGAQQRAPQTILHPQRLDDGTGKYRESLPGRPSGDSANQSGYAVLEPSFGCVHGAVPIKSSTGPFGCSSLPIFHLAVDLSAAIADADEWTARSWPASARIRTIRCKAYDGTSVQVKLCLGADRGDDTCATPIGTTLTCNAAGSTQTGLGVTTSAAQEVTVLVVDGSNIGAVTAIDVQATGE